MKQYILHVLLLLSFSLSLAAQTNRPLTRNPAKPYGSLKAVLVVGIGLDSDDTAMFTLSMNKIALFLNEKGIEVHRFYSSASDWKKINIAAKDAHFFIYAGHGSKDCSLYIEHGGSNQNIMELPLAHNAVVGFLHVCYGAGSSETDLKVLSIEEATKRVNRYADSFLKAGAGCYFANNFCDGGLLFLRMLFAGDNVDSCFENVVSHFNSKVEIKKSYKPDSSLMTGVSSSYNKGIITITSYSKGVKKVRKIPSFKNYDIAYVGNPDFSISDVVNQSADPL